MPFALRLAAFIRFYGMDAFKSPMHPTRDKVIPHRQFWLMERAIASVMASERLNDARAVAHGTAICNAGKDGQDKLTAFYHSEQDMMFGDI